MLESERRCFLSAAAPSSAPSAVHHTDIPVDDPDALAGAAGVLLVPLAHPDPLNEQLKQFRREPSMTVYRLSLGRGASSLLRYQNISFATSI